MDSNQPAFPTSNGTMIDSVYLKERSFGDSPGMTLREWYAGMAISGILFNRAVGVVTDIDERVDAAFLIADKMLERSSTKGVRA